MCSVAGHLGPAIGVFSTSGFHRFCATKPDRLSQSLFTAKIFLSGLHRDVAKKELNLFQLASSAVAETRTRPSKVMWREFCNSYLGGVLLDNMPYHFFGHFGAPNCTRPTDATK